MTGPKPKSVASRFWEKVVKTAGCWKWLGCTVKGYGKIGAQNCIGSPLAAHRVSWELHHGKIPNGFCVLHKCDNPPCCNPDHLFLGSLADNNRDRVAKGRIGNTNPAGCLVAAEKRRTAPRCKRGHLLNGDNLYASALRDGRRACRKCKALYRRKNARANR